MGEVNQYSHIFITFIVISIGVTTNASVDYSPRVEGAIPVTDNFMAELILF